MRIEVRSSGGPLSEDVRERAERSVLLALSRFGPYVLRVTVSLSEVVNPLGGIDRRCRLRAGLRGDDDVRVEMIDGVIEAAVARAAAQLALRVDSTLAGGRGDGAGSTTSIRRRRVLGSRGRDRRR